MMASSGSGDVHARQIAAGLVAAVRGAIAAARRPPEPARPEAASLAWAAAADIAELLELPGLASLLGACAGTPAGSSAAVDRALNRLARLADEAESHGDVRAFARADHELAALAAAPAAAEPTRPAPSRAAPAAAPAPAPTPVPVPHPIAGAPEDVRSLSVLLADFTFDDPAAVAKAMVTLPVAAGLRAALDWIATDTGGRLHVEVQDAAITLVTRAAQERGLGAAGAVMGLTGGALLPEPDGRWALRVPLHAAKPAFLLARQGELSLALPWHAVARLKITDEASRGAMTEPSLEPWSALARVRGERPAALLALGLSRAWLHLDHIVWRVFARPEPAEAIDAVPGGRHVVRTEEGEVFRVVDVEEALQGVTPLHTPAPAPRTPPADVPVEAPGPASLEPAGAPAQATTARVAASVPAPAVPGIEAAKPSVPIVLGAEFVRALGARAAAKAVVPAAGASPAPAPHAEKPAPELLPAAGQATPEPAGPAPRAGVPRALVVDDSLVARMELGRVLERRGWEVEWVETAAEMWSVLPIGGWSVVFVDVSLPDARGRAHLKTLAAQQRVARPRFELVALTRDESDERVVAEAGIGRMIRKPFAPGGVERALRELRGAGA
jgi:CheY-like chemotaxis protein